MLKTDADRRINALARIGTEAEVPTTDRGLIQDRMSRARFSPEKQPAWQWTLAGYGILGLEHPAEPGVLIVETTLLTSAEVHVLKRIEQGHWVPGTRPAEYVQDLGLAARHPRAWLAVGVEKQHAHSGSITGSTEVGLNLTKCNSSSDMWVLVVYDADESLLSTGFLADNKTAKRLVSRWIPFRELGKVPPPRP